jgi:hypothetical protein
MRIRKVALIASGTAAAVLGGLWLKKSRSMDSPTLGASNHPNGARPSATPPKSPFQRNDDDDMAETTLS